jgi:hypothetical protein
MEKVEVRLPPLDFLVVELRLPYVLLMRRTSAEDELRPFPCRKTVLCRIPSDKIASVAPTMADYAKRNPYDSSECGH